MTHPYKYGSLGYKEIYCVRPRQCNIVFQYTIHAEEHKQGHSVIAPGEYSQRDCLQPTGSFPSNYVMEVFCSPNLPYTYVIYALVPVVLIKPNGASNIPL